MNKASLTHTSANGKKNAPTAAGAAATTTTTTTTNSMMSNMSGASTRESIKLSAQTIAEYQEAFKFFDKDNDGYVDVNEVGRLMRSVGLYPSESEIQHIQKSTSSRNKVDFNEFLQLATSTLVDANINEQQMREAFRMFDAYGNKQINNIEKINKIFCIISKCPLKGNGFVNLMQMRNALQNLGEKLRDDEIDELIREADIDAEGNVNYDELVKILCRS